MSDATPAVVEAHLRRLDADALAALVADLWAARGHETARDGHVVEVTRGGHSKTIAAVAGSRFGSPAVDRPVDVVVAPDGIDAVPEGARVVDATRLREMLWYAVDRGTARDLCARHLGAEPAALRPPPAARAAARLRRLGTLAPSVPTALLAALALLVGAGAVAGLAVTATPSGEGAATPTPTPAAVPTATPTPTPGGPPIPGVTADGIGNATALAEAHRRILANRSYSVWMDVFRPRVPDGSRVQRDIDVAVAGDRYLLETELIGGADRYPVRTVYFDGTDWYAAEWTNATTRYRRVSGDGAAPHEVPTPSVLRRDLVTRYLAAAETRLTGRVTEDGISGYRIVGTGRPDGFRREVRNYSMTALVDQRGLVRDLEVEYVRPVNGQPTTVRFQVTYGDFGETTVDAPPWYGEQFGANATADANGTASPAATAG